MIADIGLAIEMIIEGLYTDGAHHKQWYLEQVLVALTSEESVECEKKKIEERGDNGPGIWEEGTPP